MRLNLKIGSLILIFLLIISGIIIWYYCHDLPSLNALEKKQSEQIIHINYQDSSRLINHSEITYNEIEFNQIPWQLIKAVVLTEDRRFFSHHGIDIFGIIRAYLINYKAGKIIQGGSTITQQLAKMLFLQPQKTLKRKIQEAILAMQIEQYFTKQQIITFYLNRAYFGSGNYGIKQASIDYFHKPVNQLNLYESAMLAGILKAPSKISPKNNFHLADQRAKIVLEIIKKNHLNYEIKDHKNFNFINQAKYYFSDLVLTIFNQQFKDLKNQYNELNIDSTINQETQSKLELKVENYFRQNYENIASRQIAVMVANYSGEILAMVGGKNYQLNRFNHAIDQKKIGDMIDNFIYLSALENEIKIDDVFHEINSQKINKKNLKTTNNLTFNNAFISSSHSVSKQLINQLGSNKIIDTVNASGIKKYSNKTLPNSNFNQLNFSLYDLICFFTMIANDGIIIEPYIIKKISNQNNQIIYQHPESFKKRLIKKSAVKEMKKMLRNLVKKREYEVLNFNDNIYAKISHKHDENGYWAIGFDQKKIIGIWMEQPGKKEFKNILNEKNLGFLFASLFNEL